ncbi:L-ascorbate oxidase [Aureobasidium pullulans]|uniref:L-ascorbate oxidase n=1 Tax=Aureobasidium pullulans TaxID=5580 RepID=A0A4S8ZE59_AURPU|nr:L-ascorbate oxidase [Aureobasidium pullulans]
MADQNLTMHWHGLSQRMAIFSDGTPVSQWPIAPMHYFDYEILPGESDAGTSFYHSHVGFQAVTANGALIVEDVRSPPYHYDDERILQLTDYFNKTDSVIEHGLTSNPFVWSGETNGLLINGVGVGIGKQNDSSCKLPVVDVLPGKIYRMRIIGATALSHVSMAFESHENLTIIAADARYTQSHNVSHIQVGSGQRFDILFKAKTIDELKGLNRTQFWIQFETRDRPSLYRGYASLRYKFPGAKRAITPPAPLIPPLSLPNTTYSWYVYRLGFGTSASEIQNIPYNDISGYLDFGGNAYGSTALYPEVVEYFKNVVPEI